MTRDGKYTLSRVAGFDLQDFMVMASLDIEPC